MSKLAMGEEEIKIYYRNLKHKNFAVKILAELNGCSKKEIEEILFKTNAISDYEFHLTENVRKEINDWLASGEKSHIVEADNRTIHKRKYNILKAYQTHLKRKFEVHSLGVGIKVWRTDLDE